MLVDISDVIRSLESSTQEQDPQSYPKPSSTNSDGRSRHPLKPPSSSQMAHQSLPSVSSKMFLSPSETSLSPSTWKKRDFSKMKKKAQHRCFMSRKSNSSIQTKITRTTI